MTLDPYKPKANGCAIERILYALERLSQAQDEQYYRDETFARDALGRLARAADDAMLDGGCDD